MHQRSQLCLRGHQRSPHLCCCGAYSDHTIATITETFTTPTFRVYPNNDILGVCYGGALKNSSPSPAASAEGLGLAIAQKLP